MKHMVPCPSCHRHVVRDDSSCPFCHTVLPAEVLAADVQVATQRLKRAATFAFSAAMVMGATGAVAASGTSSAEDAAMVEMVVAGAPGVIYGGDPHGRRSSDDEQYLGLDDPGAGGSAVA